MIAFISLVTLKVPGSIGLAIFLTIIINTVDTTYSIDPNITQTKIRTKTKPLVQIIYITNF